MAEVSIFEPRTMGRLITRMPPLHTFFRSTFFKRVRTFVTKSVDVDFKKGNRALAPFVHPKVGGKTVPNAGYQTKNYTPPLIAPNKITTVDDLLERAAGENIYSGRTPAERAVEKLAQDYRDLDEMISRREEWMCAQAILTGKIPIIGDGLNEEIDFGFTNYDPKATAAEKWKTDKLGYIRERKKLVQKNGFVNTDILLMSDDVVSSFLDDAKVLKLLDVDHVELAAIKPQELPNGVSYIGKLLRENMSIYTYNEWYLDDWTDPENPVQNPLLPSGLLCLLSTGANYSLYYGAVTLGDKKTDNFRTVEGARVPKAWMEYNPDRRFIQLFSKPLPVPHEVDSWSVSQVL